MTALASACGSTRREITTRPQYQASAILSLWPQHFARRRACAWWARSHSPSRPPPRRRRARSRSTPSTIPRAAWTSAARPPPDLPGSTTTNYLQMRRAGRGIEWLKVDAASGRTSPLFDAARMETRCAALPGVHARRGGGRSRAPDDSRSTRRTGALVTIADDLYFYDFAPARATRLTTAAGDGGGSDLQPGRTHASRSSARNNLYVVDVGAQRERALTTDGSAELLNGKLDWLYQEEIYGRGQFRGYWWSPDSTRLAFLQLDERPVPEYTVVDHIPYRPDARSHRLPESRRSQSHGEARRRRASPAARRRGSISATYAATDFLIVNVDWTPDAQQVVLPGAGPRADVARSQSRRRRHRDGAHGCFARRRRRGSTRTATRSWLKDGSFLWFSERSGFKHLYHYQRRRHARAAGHDRPLGRPHALRRGRGATALVYFAAGASAAHRHRHLPHRARRHRADAPVADRRHAPRDLQSRRSRSTSTSGAT